MVMWVWLQCCQDDLVQEVTLTLNQEAPGKVSHEKRARKSIPTEEITFVEAMTQQREWNV